MELSNLNNNTLRLVGNKLNDATLKSLSRTSKNVHRIVQPNVNTRKKKRAVQHIEKTVLMKMLLQQGRNLLENSLTPNKYNRNMSINSILNNFLNQENRISQRQKNLLKKELIEYIITQITGYNNRSIRNSLNYIKSTSLENGMKNLRTIQAQYNHLVRNQQVNMYVFG